MFNLCGVLNKYGPHRIICLNSWPVGSGTIRRIGLVGVDLTLLEEDVALLDEVYHCGGGL